MGRFWTTVAVVAGLWVVLDWYFRKDSSSSDREDGSPPSDQIRPPPDVRVLRPPPRQYTPVVRGRGRGARRIVRLPPSDTAIPPPLRESQDDLPLSGAVLRERAAEANRLRGEAFAESQNMHRLGLRDEARRLSQEGKEHKERMDKLNKAASERIFLENNENRNDIDGVDLHRLFVKEALLKVQEVILAAQRRGESTVRFIVGQGLHSIDGAPRLKPELTSRIQDGAYCFHGSA
ncbi:hypothetical protein DFH08DRAFT_374164 [Mycena albidolilacea]|uniref:Smr domain-containing protein n=1 Tax=Mycena albidolilacea TaxID=1033008 RepID=A0AAD7F2K0_9AGAR|nr:hypothetical protein DFH08DRAFT_374164 [Mycena albidolilacea]